MIEWPVVATGLRVIAVESTGHDDRSARSAVRSEFRAGESTDVRTGPYCLNKLNVTKVKRQYLPSESIEDVPNQLAFGDGS